MKAAEALFRPVYIILVGVGYLRFLVLLLPVLAAAFALGFFNGTAVIGRRRGGRGVGLLGFRRTFGPWWTAAAILWDAASLALAVGLGHLGGHLILLAPKGRRIGRWLTALAWAMGCTVSHIMHAKSNKER